MPKGTTSKGTVKSRSYGKKLFFMVKFPEFLGSPTYTVSPVFENEIGSDVPEGATDSRVNTAKKC